MRRPTLVPLLVLTVAALLLVSGCGGSTNTTTLAKTVVTTPKASPAKPLNNKAVNKLVSLSGVGIKAVCSVGDSFCVHFPYLPDPRKYYVPLSPGQSCALEDYCQVVGRKTAKSKYANVSYKTYASYSSYGSSLAWGYNGRLRPIFCVTALNHACDGEEAYSVEVWQPRDPERPLSAFVDTCNGETNVGRTETYTTFAGQPAIRIFCTDGPNGSKVSRTIYWFKYRGSIYWVGVYNPEHRPWFQDQFFSSFHLIH